MKTIVLLLAIVLLYTASPLHAQNSVQDTIPQLQEWWSADNMGYGGEFGRDDNGGMTWVDNFYHGKGALVVSTPDGVKTWQMRFPGDTTNIFTWNGKGGLWRTLDGGNPYIKTGDFNGDGITDYIDAWGNIYEGVQKGELPKAEAQTPVQLFNPSIIIDINGDGYDDMMTAGSVVFGESKISDFKHIKLAFPEIDSNNNGIIGVYSVASKELRILCRQRYWVNLKNFPYQRVYKDGLRLVRVWWNGNSLSSEKLDEFNVNTDDSTGIFWNGKILSQHQKKYYFIGATLISGKYDKTNVTVYDLSNDKIEKKYVNRIDRIADMKIFRHSIDDDTIPDWCIVTFQTDGYSDINLYNGLIQNGIQQIGKYSICQRTYLSSLPLYGSNPQNGIALSGNGGDCFRVVKTPSTTGVDNEPHINSFPFLIESITPQPVSSQQTIQVRLSAPLMSSYEIGLFSNTGSKLFQINTGQMSEGLKTISIPLAEYNLLKGVYWLTLTVGKQQVQSKLIIN